MNPTITITQKGTEKQELTCELCGHTGSDVRPCDFPTLDRQHITRRDICTDQAACDDRQMTKRIAIEKEIEAHMEYMSQCRRLNYVAS
jgi:hypothetical protein